MKEYKNFNTKDRKKLKKIDKKETKRLKASGVANTKYFKTRQSFGAASEVRNVSIEEYERTLND